MNKHDREYYRGRIAEEEIAAQKAAHPLAAKSHKRLAEEYASLLVATDGVSEGGSDQPADMAVQR